ncbi:polysaccharide lyase family 8 super-sandwich domain-containing protein [Bowmanella yangjiangensis]|uniref:Hyaluronate lyase n=1 Tax=Bowmanella yangjiangensis TaxID=2811230 RepID=A0ABS3CSX2_9ALTE|nr:polysaccharide lyase family 8 super-sandwich domain-containing protein [Bowmanella yangjiangensis]MBN7820218.1 hypothetical protein [Bowmanella yangjiangensis]
MISSMFCQKGRQIFGYRRGLQGTLLSLLVICSPVFGATSDLKKAKENWKTSNSLKYKQNKELLEILSDVKEDRDRIFPELPLVNSSGKVQADSITRSLFKIRKSLSEKLNDEQKQSISAALEKILGEYNTESKKVGNWWHWEIGIPRQINQVLLLSQPWLDKDLFSRLLAASHHFLPKAEFQNYGKASSSKAFHNTGANRVDTVLIVLQRALLEQDELAFSEALDKLWEVFEYVDSGDGFYRDGSYIQHKDIPYIGTYGLVLFEGVNRIFTLLQGTKWQPSSAVYHLILDRYQTHLLPFLVEERLLDAVSGRGPSRGWAQSNHRGKQVSQLLAIFKTLSPPDVVARIDLIQEEMEEADKQYRALMYPSMDRFVYRAPNYASAISMHSSRTGNYECTNGENLKGWYTGDGMLYLQLHPDDYIDFWPLVDSTSLPGTTTNAKVYPPCKGLSNIYNKPQKSQDWVGGATLDGYAAVGMDYRSVDEEVQARKSWFYLPDLVIALGSDIEGALQTNVLQRFADKPTQLKWEELDNGKTFWLENLASNTSLGVYLPYEQSASFKLNKIQGSWEELNRFSTQYMEETELSKWRARFDILHDTEKNNYAYFLFPNQEKESFRSLSTENRVKVQSQSRKSHSIWIEEESTLLANVFTKDLLEISEWFDIKGAVSLVVRKTGNVLDVSMADPSRSQGHVELLFKSDFLQQGDGEGRAKVKDNAVLVNMSGLNGSSLTLRFLLN